MRDSSEFETRVSVFGPPCQDPYILNVFYLLISTHIVQENRVQVKVHRLSEGAIQLKRDEIEQSANSRTILQIYVLSVKVKRS